MPTAPIAPAAKKLALDERHIVDHPIAIAFGAATDAPTGERRSSTKNLRRPGFVVLGSTMSLERRKPGQHVIARFSVGAAPEEAVTTLSWLLADTNLLAGSLDI